MNTRGMHGPRHIIIDENMKAAAYKNLAQTCPVTILRSLFDGSRGTVTVCRNPKIGVEDVACCSSWGFSKDYRATTAEEASDNRRIALAGIIAEPHGTPRESGPSSGTQRRFACA